NAGTGEAVWTNISSTANHLHLKDPGVNIGGLKWVIEAITNDPNFLYYNPDDDPSTHFEFSDWGDNTGPGTDILGFLWGTNFSASSTSLSVLSNAFVLQRTNLPVVSVNSLTGNDVLAIGSAGFKYQNLSNACFDPRLGNGGVINVEAGLYPE